LRLGPLNGAIQPFSRYIIIDLVVGELTLTICNIYAPNKDDPAFFQNVSEQMTSFKCEEIIFGGDFNLVLDVLKDKKGGKPSRHQNSLKMVQNFRNNLDLTDIWRDLNPEERRYTWRQNKPKKEFLTLTPGPWATKRSGKDYKRNAGKLSLM